MRRRLPARVEHVLHRDRPLRRGGRGGADEGAGAEELADGEGVGVDGVDAAAEVARVALHVDRVFAIVRVFVRSGHVRLQRSVVPPVRVQHQTAGGGRVPVSIFREHVCEQEEKAHLPPMTLASPLKILLRLLTTTSA